MATRGRIGIKQKDGTIITAYSIGIIIWRAQATTYVSIGPTQKKY